MRLVVARCITVHVCDIEVPRRLLRRRQRGLAAPTMGTGSRECEAHKRARALSFARLRAVRNVGRTLGAPPPHNIAAVLALLLLLLVLLPLLLLMLVPLLVLPLLCCCCCWR